MEFQTLSDVAMDQKVERLIEKRKKTPCWTARGYFQ